MLIPKQYLVFFAVVSLYRSSLKVVGAHFETVSQPLEYDFRCFLGMYICIWPELSMPMEPGCGGRSSGGAPILFYRVQDIF